MAPNRRRGQILDLAEQMLDDGGYARTTLGSMAVVLEVTEPAIYYYFKGKDALVAAVVEPFLDAVDELLASDAAADIDRRGELLTAYGELLVDYRRLARIMERDALELAGVDPIGPRDRDQTELLRRRLMADDSIEAMARASAAIGAIRRPATQLDSFTDPVVRRAIVSAAAEIVGAAVPAGVA